jgi:hypothetical protein
VGNLHREVAIPIGKKGNTMPYTFDQKSAESSSYELLKEGEYEVFIEKATIKTTTTGKQKISLQLRVRSDVEQEAKNRVIFEDIWKERENPNFFNRKRINQLLGTQHFSDGTAFENVEKLLEAITGANLIVKVGIDFDEYYKKDVNYVSYYKTTKAVAKSAGSKADTKKPTAKEIKDEDLPF